MFTNRSMHKDEKGQTALETAIILIAFVVVASVFAFTILSAGSSSTEKGKQAIQAGLEGVQSSMNVKGSIIAEAAGSTVDSAIFTVSLVAGGSPVNLSATAKEVVIGYKDQKQFVNDVPWKIKWIVSKQATADDMLEDGELAEITVDLTTATGGRGQIDGDFGQFAIFEHVVGGSLLADNPFDRPGHIIDELLLILVANDDFLSGSRQIDGWTTSDQWHGENGVVNGAACCFSDNRTLDVHWRLDAFQTGLNSLLALFRWRRTSGQNGEGENGSDHDEGDQDDSGFEGGLTLFIFVHCLINVHLKLAPRIVVGLIAWLDTLTVQLNENYCQLIIRQFIES